MKGALLAATCFAVLAGSVGANAVAGPADVPSAAGSAMPASESAGTISSIKPRVTLRVDRTGAGSGRVSLTPPGVSCERACIRRFAPSTVVTLVATPDPGSKFTGWQGAGCSGTGDCVVTMNRARRVVAGFKGPVLGRPSATPGTATVGPGQEATFELRVRNKGDAAAKRLKVCVSGAESIFRLPSCVKPGKLLAERSSTIEFTVKVKNGVTVGKTGRIVFEVTATGVRPRFDTATVKVR